MFVKHVTNVSAGNPRVIQVSDKVLELEITNVSSKHTGLYACRDRSVSRNGQTEMSLYVVATGT